MNEKQKEMMEQYDMVVENSYRSRGCLHLVTDRGLCVLTPYNGSPVRLAWECELQKKLLEQGFSNLDVVLPNREDGFIVYDKYRSPFIVKKAYEGKECNLKEEKELRRACENLALLHKVLRSLDDFQVENRNTPSLLQMQRAKASELKRIRNYIKKSGRKMEFELTFTSCYEQFYQEAVEVLCWLEGKPASFYQRGFGICHGAYHQHNVLLTEENVYTLNLGQFHYNQQLMDLYNIVRKALEKNQYQKKIFDGAMEAYGKILPLEKEDHEILYGFFSFPEKFWKISNQYYNGKKCWMPPKNLDKLKKTVGQNEKRLEFLRRWRAEEGIGW